MSGSRKTGVIFFSVFFLLLISCSSTQRKKSLTLCEQQILSLIPTNDFSSATNQANTHIIFIQRQKEKEFKYVRFVVMSTKDCKVLTEQYFLPGYVKWKTNDEIELLNLPEIVPAGKNIDDYIKIISIATLSKQQ